MFGVLQILVSAAVLAVLALLPACGQKGPLVLPSGAAAAGRASLPATVLPESMQPTPSTATAPATAASGPATGTAAPVRTP